MTGEYKTPVTPDDAAAGDAANVPASHPRHEAWQPRIQRDAPLNAFESDSRGHDSAPPSSTIRDARKDTAPLQGEHDMSDDDSLANE